MQGQIASLLLRVLVMPAVLCGNSSEACWAKYGSYPLHRPYCHEMALRILLACVEVDNHSPLSAPDTPHLNVTQSLISAF